MSELGDKFFEAINQMLEAKFGQRVRRLESRDDSFAEDTNGRLSALEREVDALKAQKSTTTDGRCVVPEARILRWERIERAVDEAIRRLEFAHPDTNPGVARFVLMEAIKPCR